MSRDESERARRLAAGGVIEHSEVAARLAEYARQRPEIEAIWLFGSQAHGAARRTSDLDLALQVHPRPPVEGEIYYRADQTRELEALLEMPTDVVVLSAQLPLPLLWEIVGSPCLVYEREDGIGAEYASYLRGLCRDQWPRLERRWKRTEEWLKVRECDAAAEHS